MQTQTNTIQRLQDRLHSAINMAEIGKTNGFSEESDTVSLAYLFEAIHERLEEVDELVDRLRQQAVQLKPEVVKPPFKLEEVPQEVLAQVLINGRKALQEAHA